MSGSSPRRPVGDALVGSGLDVACAWAQLPGSVSLRRRERAKRKGPEGSRVVASSDIRPNGDTGHGDDAMRRLPVTLLAVLASLTFSVATVSPPEPVHRHCPRRPGRGSPRPPAPPPGSRLHGLRPGHGEHRPVRGLAAVATSTTRGPSTARPGRGSPPPPAPPPRTYASIGLRPGRREHGPVRGSGNSSDLDDTWTFNGTTWTRLSPATSPPARARLHGLRPGHGGNGPVRGRGQQ